jgi:general secretion pathway protein M
MNFLQNLGTREKMLVMGAAVVVLLTLLFTLVIDPMLAYSGQLDRQIRKAQQELKELQARQQEYLQQKQVLDRINTQLTQQQNFALFSRLEELARNTNTRDKILYMKPTLSTPSDAYEEEAVEIKMEGVTLEQLVTYLYQVEQSPQFLKIKRLYLKPRLNDRQLLTAIFRISTFRPKQGSS